MDSCFVLTTLAPTVFWSPILILEFPPYGVTFLCRGVVRELFLEFERYLAFCGILFPQSSVRVKSAPLNPLDFAQPLLTHYVSVLLPC